LTRGLFLNINNVMAIRRCPYCKAIIDEGSEYCSNCGTQLLFPEDEYIQEEIPGEEIVEEEEPEEKPKKKKSLSKRRKKEKEQEEIDLAEAEGEEEPVSKEEMGEQRERSEEEPEEELNQEEIAAEMLRKAEMEESPIEEEAPAEVESAGEDFELPPGKGRDEYFVEEDKEASIKTEDLEKIIDPEEKEKAEIEKFLRSLKEDRGKWGEIPPTDELPPWAEEIKEKQPDEIPTEAREEKVQEVVEPEEEHPTFEEAEQKKSPLEEEPLTVEEEQEKGQEREPDIQEEDISDLDELHPDETTPEEQTPDIELPLEEIQEKTAPEAEIAMPDTSMGLPEGVEQEKLPFDEKPGEMFGAGEKASAVKLPNWVKSRAFDVLFIAAIWIVTIHIASRMMATNLFRLISVAILPVVAFYLVLLGVYMFLFFLFLGQTLGDHLFPHEE
jgi:hypothetical protein